MKLKQYYCSNPYYRFILFDDGDIFLNECRDFGEKWVIKLKISIQNKYYPIIVFNHMETFETCNVEELNKYLNRKCHATIPEELAEIIEQRSIMAKLATSS